MRNVYGYTTINDLAITPGYAYIKVGDSHHTAHVRTKQQQTGQSSSQIVLNPSGNLEDRSWEWRGLKRIKGDSDLHAHKALAKYKLPAKQSGDEWFAIPVDPSLSDEEKVRFLWRYIDDIVTDLEGHKVRPSVRYRVSQISRHNQAMRAISQGKTEGIAFLCPRSGKTLWALGMFDRLTKTYGNRVMLVPVYWLSVHTSFEAECEAYSDFQDIVVVRSKDEDSELAACMALREGKRVLVLISLCGKFEDGVFEEEDMSTWVKQNRWVQQIPNDDKFMFADEGDYGSHTAKQLKKLEFLFANK